MLGTRTNQSVAAGNLSLVVPVVVVFVVVVVVVVFVVVVSC